MKKFLKKGLVLILCFFLLMLSQSTVTFSTTTKDKTLKTNESKTVQTIDKLNNNYPIIMIHGLFGWGNDEFCGVNYWGGENSLKSLLQNKGFKVFTPTLGSISSNWDRVCELYAYLVGGTVDYGEFHSKKNGHARYGRTYPGVYPELGTMGPDGLRKIHLLGHSMGGQTSRLLAHLLENGDSDEVKNSSSKISPLFTGNHHFIHSITTLCTPHDGSQAAEKLLAYEPLSHDLFATLASSTGFLNSNNPLFDFRLDQWGLKKLPNETCMNYYEKIFSSKIWAKTKDLSLWDLSLEGAKEFNSFVKAQDDIYYFSISCVDTHKQAFTNYQVPNANMNPILWASSVYLGYHTSNIPSKVTVNSSWWVNDGIVSLRSAIGPHEGSKDKIIDYNSNSVPSKGIWNYIGQIDNVDHIEVVGQYDTDNQLFLQNKFLDLAKMLSNLPN